MDYATQFLELTTQRKYKLAMALVDQMIAEQVPPETILTDVVALALQKLQAFDESPDAAGYSSLTLLAIAKICDDAVKKIEPLMAKRADSLGTVVIGTPPNEYHSLGKTIVSSFLRSYGWRVIDLGFNVSGKAFVDAAQAHQADFIMVSAFLMPSALRSKEIIDELKRSPIAGTCKIVVGGPPFKFHLGLANKLGADGTGVDAFEAIRVIRRLQGYDLESEKKMEKTSRFKRLARRIFGFGGRRDEQ
jgi:methanogenic corrinoid protein MtbC1